MRRPAALLALLLAGCGDGAGPSTRDLEIRIEASRGEVDLGRPFPVTVVRAWDRDLEPAPWSDAALAPLVVRPISATRTERAGRIEERREFLAAAFSLDEVKVPPPRLEASPKGGGATRAVAGRGIALRVRPALDPRNPGKPEPAGPPPAPPGRFDPAPYALILAVAAAAFALLRRKPRPAPATPPGEAALARLRALRADGDAGAFHDGLTGALRDFLAGRFGLRTRERTSEEILGALEERRRAALGDLLARADRVRFGGERPGPDALRAAGREAEAFVEAER